ncbi:hypothetical protein CsSME_00028009 [Camellia sinensis var. sinensis]
MSFSSLLRLYANTRSILKGRAVHGKLISSGFHPDVYTTNHLLSMYLKFNLIDDARNVFDRMPEQNVISWTTFVTWFSQMGLSEEALNCFRSMVAAGFLPNHYSYASALSACASIGNARTGKEIHGKIYRTGEELNSYVSNCLVNLYGKCGMLKSARFVFDDILEPNSVSWTSLLSCYCQCGENLEGLKIFMQSQKAGVKVNEFSCVSVLGACAALEKLDVGMQVHSHSVKCGIRNDPFVVTGLINLYAKCGNLDLAYQALWEVNNPQLPAWTTLIGGCVQQGKGREAIGLFCKLHSLGFKPNEMTFSSVLGAFADAMKIKVGKQLHSLIVKLGFFSFTFVGNAVVDFYLKSGLMKESWKAFEEMDAHDIVSWNTLVSGCVNSGHCGEAIEFLNLMLSEGFEPNLYTYSSVLSICGNLPAIEWGRQTHCCIMKPGFDSNVVVGSALIDMYAKCGRLSDAQRVFDNLASKNLVSWNTMLVGYAQHGFGREALEIYDMMQRDGVKPNDVTFIGVLSACGHVGLLEKGLRYFDSMTKDYEITPRTDHLACMVSLFARKGQTKGAYDFIKHFPIEPDKVVWRCLLSGCKTNKDLALGKYAAEQILSIDPDDTSAHIMLSNIYAEAKMWRETAQMRRIMKEKALKKDPGYSWTELKKKIYSFSAGHNMDFQGYSVHEILNGLTAQLFDAGYVPDAMFSLDYEEYIHQELSA